MPASLDDRDARRHAHALELAISGTLGVLLLARRRAFSMPFDPFWIVFRRCGSLDARTRQSVRSLPAR